MTAFAIGILKKLASPRALAIALLLLMVATSIILWAVFTRAIERRRLGLAPAPDSPDRDNLRRLASRFKLLVIFLPILLVYASWETRGGPIGPRVVGAIMNLLFTFVFFRALRRTQARLKELDSETQK
jgi:hypothetical protein